MTVPDTSFLPGTPSQRPAFYQGDDWTWGFRVRHRNPDGTAGEPVDLTGCTVQSQIRASKDDAAVLLELVGEVAADQTLDSTTRGVVLLSATGAMTASVPVSPGKDSELFPWDVQITYTDGRVQTYMTSDFEVWKQVTRP